MRKKDDRKPSVNVTNPPPSNMVQVVFTCPTEWLDGVPKALKGLAQKHASIKLPIDLPALIRKIKKLYIRRAMREAKGDRVEAAKLLGIKTSTIYGYLDTMSHKDKKHES